ncbi:MAG: tetratricopeptide repeat protein [Bacteroidales bacterium]|nr:tetratricopeptide repeat protein [Bacteroidales bacterium]
MAVLKQFSITGIIILALAFSKINAQTNAEIQSAFKTSYELETKGEYNKAIDEIKKVYKEDSYEINLRLGWLSYSAGQFTTSKSYYTKAINLMPYGIEARFGIVYPASAMGNWDEVITQYKKILEVDPQNSVANYRLGVIYYERKDYTKANSYLEKVVNLYPFDYDGLLMYAWCNFQLGNHREAKVLFNKVLLLSPDDSSAKEGLGLLK